jgi:hypothetical protein
MLHAPFFQKKKIKTETNFDRILREITTTTTRRTSTTKKIIKSLFSKNKYLFA